ncbi:TatD family hydrolase [Limibacter armeniacum]|uniref:TatD family hydrolase n=1 Tax=Limibacter armeniacum TaxID=466084 RepID=UPI002FE54BBA
MDKKLKLIDPHIHMTSRTTDDYERMAKAGIVAIIEPSFWMGQPRTEVGSFKDYYNHLIGWERFRASQFGIKHYCTIGLNSKEANNEPLAEAVMELLPKYVCKEGVVGIGEIGYDDQTAAEDKYFRMQLELSKLVTLPVQVHTPHRDKKAGTIRSMDVCEEHGLEPSMVIIDHNNEETVESVLDRGYWAAFTIYPRTKMGNERMAAVVKKYGPERIIVDSSADWGVSDPLAVPKTARLMLDMGIPEEHVHMVCYQNALAAYSQSGQMKESDWEDRIPIDQRRQFNENSVLRGQDPLVESDNIIS